LNISAKASVTTSFKTHAKEESDVDSYQIEHSGLNFDEEEQPAAAP
jgi:hypothetical protein